ncbi:MAG: leucyl/phenylalanyl-tRNA--protein transferase [Alphaproteobacteria bacterium]|jgi:leucyl/phenylalanyl-tRNA--protein transferase|nr:leucyl/phenylalanyl-tRNA--protein transferase [Alphaproteobacteria bacterium]
MTTRLDTATLLRCYRRGVFPMAEAHDDPRLFLVDPDMRGILPLHDFHVPRRLKRTVRQDVFEVTVNRSFSRVMEGCAAPAPDRENTWINPLIVNLYGRLHREGHAHSVETWKDGRLAGGLYGVSIGGAFFGESMFSRARDASKVALVHLVARLIRRGYGLLDAQFHNPHLEQFGLVEIHRAHFKSQLDLALRIETDFGDTAHLMGGKAALDVIEQARAN